MKPSAIGNSKNDYAQYVAKGMEVLHSRKTRDSIVAILKNGKNPVQVVANAAVMVLQRLDGAARTAGIEIQDIVKLYAANEFVTQICEIAEAARLFKLDQDHKELALSVAAQDYIREEIAAGRIDPARLQAQIAQGMRKLTPQQRGEIDASIKKIQQIGARYRG